MEPIRNIAIIAHVDHGKTTLVDKIIDACKVLDDRTERTDLLLDNNDLERERGITILSKNVSVNYNNGFSNVFNRNYYELNEDRTVTRQDDDVSPKEGPKWKSVSNYTSVSVGIFF